MVCPCRLSTVPRRLPGLYQEHPVRVPYNAGYQLRLTAWQPHCLTCMTPSSVRRRLPAPWENYYRRDLARNDFLLLPCWRAEVEPVTSPRSHLKSDHEDSDKNVTLWVIVVSVHICLKSWTFSDWNIFCAEVVLFCCFTFRLIDSRRLLTALQILYLQMIHVLIHLHRTDLLIVILIIDY